MTTGTDTALVKEAMDKLIKDDQWLLQSDANERSISHKLAEHLQTKLPEWHVDCEYNRDGISPKRLVFPKTQPHPDDEHAITVFPDIIVHHRNSNDNRLVIEMKKSTNPDKGDFDKQKLKAFVEQLGYSLGLFITVTVGKTPSYLIEEFR